mmetsp:Transcript_33475/g.80921  ORF Transcript_33475/g.80921 Transcript_33475/m.80921 type:complete len:249 (-) Transcript_33475:32-778(-)
MASMTSTISIISWPFLEFATSDTVETHKNPSVLIILLHRQLLTLVILPLHPLRRLAFLLVIRLLNLVPIRAKTRTPRCLHGFHHGAPGVLIGVLVNLLEQSVEGLVPLRLLSVELLGDGLVDGVPVAVGGVGAVFCGVVDRGDGRRTVVGLVSSIAAVLVNGATVVRSIIIALVTSFLPTLLRPCLLSVPALALVDKLIPLQFAILLLQFDQHLLLLDDGAAFFGNHLLVEIAVDHRVFHKAHALSRS